MNFMFFRKMGNKWHGYLSAHSSLDPQPVKFNQRGDVYLEEYDFREWVSVMVDSGEWKQTNIRSYVRRDKMVVLTSR